MTQETEDESAKLLREFNARHSLEDAPVETPKTKSATAVPEAAPAVPPTATAPPETDSALAEFYKTHGIPRDVVPPVVTTPEEALSPGDAALAGGAAGWLAGKQPLQSAAYGSAEAARAADAAKVARAGVASAAEALAKSQGAHGVRLNDLFTGMHATSAGVGPARQALEQAVEHARSVGAIAPEVTALDVMQHTVPKGLANPETSSLAREVSQQIGAKSRAHVGDVAERTLQDLYRRGVVPDSARITLGQQGPLVSSTTGRVLLPQSAAAALEPTAAELAARRAAVSQVAEAHAAHKTAQEAAAAARIAFEKAHAGTAPAVDTATALHQRAAQAAAETEEAARLANAAKESKYGLSTLGRVARRIPGLGILSGGMGAYDLTRAYEEAKAGNYGGAALKGLSGIGGLVSMIPTPMTVGAGMAMQAPELASTLYDLYKGKP